MAWFMDTYSMYQGVTVPEIVTGKPVGSGGTLGRARRPAMALRSWQAERSNVSPSRRIELRLLCKGSAMSALVRRSGSHVAA
jgi:hypothetical protein